VGGSRPGTPGSKRTTSTWELIRVRARRGGGSDAVIQLRGPESVSHGWEWWRLGAFAAGGSPEDCPGDEVVSEIDEAMLRFRGDEEDVALVEGMRLVGNHQRAAAFHDDVELVLRMLCLVVAATRGEDEDRHGAVLEEGFVPDAFGPSGGRGEREM